MLFILYVTLPMVWLGGPIWAWISNRFRPKPFPPVVLFVLTVIGAYLVLLLSVWVADAHMKAEMDSYDLDGSGSIGGSELTPAAKRAMNRWSSDTGRALAPIIGLPLSGIWSAVVFAVMYSGLAVFRKIRPDATLENTDSHEDPAELQIKTSAANTPADDRNPYQPPHGT